MYRSNLQSTLISNFRWAEPHVDRMPVDFLSWWLAMRAPQLMHMDSAKVTEAFRSNLNAMIPSDIKTSMNDVLTLDLSKLAATDLITIAGEKYAMINIDDILKIASSDLGLFDAFFQVEASDDWQLTIIEDTMLSGFRGMITAALSRSLKSQWVDGAVVGPSPLPEDDNISGVVNYLINKVNEALVSFANGATVLLCDSDEYASRMSMVGYYLFGEKNGNV